MKTIHELSESTLRRRLKEIGKFPLPLDEVTTRTRNEIEARLWDIYVESHPPIHTPKGFVDDHEEW